MRDIIIGLVSATIILTCFLIDECRINKELKKELLQTEILLLKEKLNCKAQEVK